MSKTATDQHFLDFLSRIDINNTNINTSDRLYIFGRNPELSLAELVARCNISKIIPVFKEITQNGAFIGSNKQKFPSIQNCGALLRRCKPIATFSKPLNSDEIYAKFSEYAETMYFEEKGAWGISSYNESETEKISKNESDTYDSFYYIIKKVLKEQKIRKALYTKPQEGKILAPLRVGRKRIIKEGAEFILWHRENEIIFCQTEEIIDINGFAKRDKDRPNKRPLLLIGLALARAMVNLTSLIYKRNTVPVYDPFCGMGSIVAEAYLLGMDAWGSDIDHVCETQSRENLTWLSSKKQYRKRFGRFPEDHIFTMDVTKPNPNFCAKFEGSIVAETNLLTPLKIYPDINTTRQLLRSFEQNYHGYLSGIRQILKPGNICVLVFPRIHTDQHTRESLPIKRLLQQYGFRICNMAINNAKIPAIFVHEWKEQRIEREIVVFQKI